MASLAPYRRLFGTPGLPPLVVFSVLARLPIGILSLAMVLFVRDRSGSFATAGVVAAAFALCAGVFSPLQGRAVDRLGQTRVLVPATLVHSAALAALIALGLGDAPDAALVACAAAAGASMPPVSACSRPLLIELLQHDTELLVAGYALDSIMVEILFIVGPLLTALLVAAFSPAAALGAGAGFALFGTLAFASLPVSRAWRGKATTTGIAGALASPGMRTLVFAALPIGICFGTLEVALPAFGADHGAANLGGVLFAGIAIGSICGGLVYGIAAGRLGSLSRGYLVLVAALPVCLALLALPGSVALMLVLVPFGGCVIAPLTSAENQLLSAVAPGGAATEAYTWVIMSTVIGAAAGNAVSGALVHAAGWRTALLTACGIAALGAALAISRRETLRPVVAG